MIKDEPLSSGYGHTVVTTNHGTFTSNPWAESNVFSNRQVCHSSVSGMSPVPPVWSSLQVLTSYESTSHSDPSKVHVSAWFPEDKPKLSRLEKKRLAAKRQRERKKCEISEASQRLACLQATLSDLQQQNHALRVKSVVMENLVKTSDDQLRMASLVSRVGDADQAGILSHIVSSQHSESAATPGLDIDLKDIANARVDVEQFKALWKKAILRGFALYGKGSSQEELDQFTLDLMTWMENWSLVNNSDTYLNVMSTNLEEGCVASPPPDHWVQVAAALDLSDEQKQQAAMGLQVVGHLMERVTAEQQSVCSHLEDSLLSTNDLVHSHSDVSLMHDTLIDKLKCALCRERFVSDLCDSFLWKHVLTCRQKLAAALNSYPFFPDAISILHGIERLGGKELVSFNSNVTSQSNSDSWSS